MGDESFLTSERGGPLLKLRIEDSRLRSVVRKRRVRERGRTEAARLDVVREAIPFLRDAEEVLLHLVVHLAIVKERDRV